VATNRRLPTGPPLTALAPMLLGEARPFDDPAWLYEIKFDGYRMLAEVDGPHVYLQSRNGANATGWFPEVVGSLAGIGGGRHVIDGEMCVLDDIGRSDFNRLHARARMRGWRPGADPAAFCVFDLLVHAGKSTMALPLIERKKRLTKLFSATPPSTLVVGHFEGEGRALYDQAVQLRLEGIVAKRQASPYVPGQRSADWLKIKRPGATPAQAFQREPF